LIIISIFIGFIIAFIHNKGLLYKLAKFLRISSIFGNQDLYTEFIQGYCSEKDYWVYVRDFKHGLTYWGAIRQYSDTEASRELIMTDVRVYLREDSTFLYEVPVLYLPINNDDFTIEKGIIKKE